MLLLTVAQPELRVWSSEAFGAFLNGKEQVVRRSSTTGVLDLERKVINEQV